tara:strand:+ start:66 stop:335 length:270 start_codon:yes stop_codon:yes gene_type:complete
MSFKKENFIDNPMEKDENGCMPNGIGPAKTQWCKAVNMCVSPDHYDPKGCESIIEMVKHKASGINNSLIIIILIGLIVYFYFSKTTKFL